ncbi:hypothetical protein PVBG_05232 [Plasmodium vivax Brazil I]|uniref:Uncharacterized protein n=1 Tax=Plasmodium vivax (strain Brazil I) TaxID=1033975 RepID=A0A0J9SWM0_PLAV1|nr:hypothetical protein PVBG_05232 [Plasmodium vivax Brazil I]
MELLSLFGSILGALSWVIVKWKEQKKKEKKKKRKRGQSPFRREATVCVFSCLAFLWANLLSGVTSRRFPWPSKYVALQCASPSWPVRFSKGGSSPGALTKLSCQKGGLQKGPRRGEVDKTATGKRRLMKRPTKWPTKRPTKWPTKRPTKRLTKRPTKRPWQKCPSELQLRTVARGFAANKTTPRCAPTEC